MYFRFSMCPAFILLLWFLLTTGFFHVRESGPLTSQPVAKTDGCDVGNQKKGEQPISKQNTSNHPPDIGALINRQKLGKAVCD